MKIFISIFFITSILLLAACSKKEIVVNEPEIIETPGFYTLNIVASETITPQEKIDFRLEERIKKDTNFFSGNIKRRGGFSIGFPKHSFSVDLENDVPLAELAADDDWVLNANYIDKTFLRHVYAYELFFAMNPNNIVSNTKFVEVEINGDYNGLYVLMEKLDRSVFGVDKEDPTAVIFKEPHIFRASYDGIEGQKPGNFHQQTFPDIEDEDKTAFIENVRDFILNSEDAFFTSNFGEVFDLDNIIDWHLLLLISNNSDGILKNFYIYKKDAATPLRIAPWDYDHSFGRQGDNGLNLDTHPLDITRSILFSRLLENEWYVGLLKTRWDELNDSSLFSVNGLKSRLADKEKVVAPFVEKNFEVWPVDGPWYHDNNNFDQEIEIINQFIDLRHARLTTYFDEL